MSEEQERIVCVIPSENGDYRIIHDAPNFTAQKQEVITKGKNAGATQWTTLGYHGTLRAAFYGVFSKADVTHATKHEMKHLLERITALGTQIICLEARFVPEGFHQPRPSPTGAYVKPSDVPSEPSEAPRPKRKPSVPVAAPVEVPTTPTKRKPRVVV